MHEEKLLSIMTFDFGLLHITFLEVTHKRFGCPSYGGSAFSIIDDLEVATTSRYGKCSST